MSAMDFAPRCPICRALVRWDGNAYRPFCSERCQLIDLGQWATEQYRVPGPATDSSIDAETADDGDPDESEPS
jgi:endogenous inhibitor of DNA gyrase (YacG/DUF329 family)